MAAPSLSMEWSFIDFESEALNWELDPNLRQHGDKKDTNPEAIVVMECIHFHVFLQ